MKSVLSRRRGSRSCKCNNFCVSIHHSAKHQAYTDKETDFITAYIVQLDIWYIIPIEYINGRITLRLYPMEEDVPNTDPQFEHFKEAWDYLNESMFLAS